MRSILGSLLLLLVVGCSSKYCGIDKDIFLSFDKAKQEEICKEYIQKEAELEKIRQQRALIEARNRKKELENEHLRLKALYKTLEASHTPYGFVDVTIEGAMGHKKFSRIAPVATTLADGEAQKVCLHSGYQEGCFWIAYVQRRVFINPILPYEKTRRFSRFVIDPSDISTSKDTIVIPAYKEKRQRVEFDDGWRMYRLRIDIHPLFAKYDE